MRIKLIIILVLAISAVSFVGYVSYHGLSSLMSTIEEAIEPDAREEEIEALLFRISEAENNLRIYTITRETKYLYPYYRNLAKADSTVQFLLERSENESYVLQCLDTIDQLLNKKTGIQNRLIRLSQQQDRIDVYQEVLTKIQSLERRNVLIDSLKNAINQAEETLEKEILEKEKEIESPWDTIPEVRRGFFRRIFKSDKKFKEEQLANQPEVEKRARELDTLLAVQDTLSTISDTLKNENFVLEIERTLTEIETRQDTLTKELALIELTLTIRDKALGSQIQDQATGIQRYFAQLDLVLANDASAFFKKITNQITIIGSIFSMLFIILVFVVLHDININQRYRKELELAKNDAERLAQAKEDFLSNMSHEIRTPLNAILGFAEQLNTAELKGEHRKQLGIIQSASTHLLSIINDILDYAKIDAGKIQLDKIPFSIEENARIVYDTFYKNANDKNIEYRLNLGHSIKDQIVVGDPVRFRQILFNLTGIAIKFTENGSVIISIDRDAGDIFMKVIDTGIGMDKNNLDLIFNKFDQIPSTNSSKKYGGTGLGLAIVKNLVELQGGSVSVVSEAGRGTEFTVKLPYPQQETDYKKPTNPVLDIDFSQFENIRVLIVDDEQYNRVLLETVLDKYNIYHESAKSGKEALEIFHKERFDVVLMDLLMNDLDGFEATRTLREKYGASIPIIALTATATRDIKEKCIKAGMNDVMIKPISENDLLKCLSLSFQSQVYTPSKNETSHDVELEDIDMNTLSKIFQNDKTLTVSMTKLYLASLMTFVSGFSEGIDTIDTGTIRANAHKIIPSSRHMGFTRFADQLKQLELSLINKAGFNDLTEQLERIRSAANHIIARLKAFIDESEEK
ncbi:MAG: ATP-binding protein [Cyclobacteriaceae bacterium]|nr:ATP-binding protein [Cyclobacteriaceae bacterium]